MQFLNATVNGAWKRVRIDGPRTLENVDAAVGRAAARSVGRQSSAVVSVRTDGWRPGFVRLFVVTVATGPRRHGVTPVVTVNVNIELQPELA